MKTLQKFVSTILIISIVSGLAWNILLFKPKEAKATDLGGSWANFVQTVLANLKELVLDTVARTVARTMSVKLQRDLIRWAQGGFSKENKPFVMREWKEELLNAVNVGTSQWLAEFNQANMCQPFRATLEIGTYLTTHNYQLPSYPQAMACTFQDIFENAEDFFKNPTLTFVAHKDSSALEDEELAFNERWRPWLHQAVPKGNLYGVYIEGQMERAGLLDIAQQNKDKEVITNQGYLNEGICNKTDLQGCQDICNKQYGVDVGPPSPDLQKCLDNCEKRASMGICVDRTITKLGTTIKTGIDKAVGSDIDWLITTDEITELIGVFFSALLNKAMHGLGFIATGPGTYTYKAASQSKKPDYKEAYGYFKASRTTVTMASAKNLRAQISANIFKNIGSLRSSVQCGGDEEKQQMRIEQIAESLPEILEGEVQHLYTGLAMVDLKPDYKVLDPLTAPFAVYGTTWDEIPYAMYPPACAQLTKEFGSNMECKKIITNLPYELNITRINSICTATCLSAIAESREECSKVRDDCVYTCSRKPASESETCESGCHSKYNTCASNAISEAINAGKCSGATPPPTGWPSGGGGGGSGGGEEVPYMYKLEEPMTPFEEIFEKETKANSMPLSLGQIIGSNPAVEQCLTGAELIQNTENRCGQCIKEIESKCENESDLRVREACIKGATACYDENDAFYTNIAATGIPPITDGLDFYNRCSIAQKKDACYVCLKEYFVPASYCQQVLDYMSRAFVKYPVVTYIENLEKSWVVKIFTSSTFLISGGAGIGLLLIGGPLGGLIGAGVGALFGWLFGSSKKPDPGNWWIGWYDADSGCKNNKDAPENQIPVGLICRAFEEFKYEGVNVCAQCSATPKERKDLADFEPTDTDCGGKKIGEAIVPQAIIASGVFKARTKCCAALAGDEKTYRACRFGEKVSAIGTTEPYPCKEVCRLDYRECMTACKSVRGEEGECAGCEDEWILCSEVCVAEETPAECGNGTVEKGEKCDNGKHCSDGTSCTSSERCIGIGDEMCIPRDLDGCSVNCLSNETCGNNYLDTLLGEECDDANTNPGDGCSADCKLECGNGVLDGEEVCDDGNTASGDGCSANCLSNETCGNNYLDTAVGEECDDNNTANGDGCSQYCGLECTGEALGCMAFRTDELGCANQDGCSYQETEIEGKITTQCLGTAKKCSEYNNQTGCNGQQDCTWVEGKTP